MIIVITGGRDFTDRARVYSALDQLNAAYPVTGLVYGCARGADTLAADWARSRGITTYPHPADWESYGKGAGHIRNAAMLRNDPRPVYCVAFPGGRGTADMTRKAIAAGLVVWAPYANE